LFWSEKKLNERLFHKQLLKPPRYYFWDCYAMLWNLCCLCENKARTVTQHDTHTHTHTHTPDSPMLITVDSLFHSAFGSRGLYRYYAVVFNNATVFLSYKASQQHQQQPLSIYFPDSHHW